MNIKIRIVFIILFLLLTLYIIGFIDSTNVTTNVYDTIVQVVFNDCYAVEKLGEDFVENSDHEIGSEIFDADVNHFFSEIHIDKYKHIHYLLPRLNGGYYCAAIGNDGMKYLLSLNDKRTVISLIKVDNLPAKLFECKNMLFALYVDDDAVLYIVDFQREKQELLIDGISIDGSNKEYFYKDVQGYFEMHEYEYQEYIKSGKDLLFTLFDNKCFENIYVCDTSIAYKTVGIENEWIVKQGKNKYLFSSADRCFGFVGNNELLFYKSISLGLYDIGFFYKYDYIKKIKSDFKALFNRGIIQGEVFDDKKILYFSSTVGENVQYYCLNTKTGEYYRILKGCPVIGYFTKMVEGRFW